MESKDRLSAAAEAEKQILLSLIYNYNIVSAFITPASIDPNIFFTPVARRVFQAVSAVKPVEDQFDLVDIYSKLESLCANEAEFKSCSEYIEPKGRRVYYFALQDNIRFLQAYKVDIKMKSLAKDIKDYKFSIEGFDDQLLSWRDEFKSISESHQSTLKFLPAANAIDSWTEASKRYRDGGGVDYLKTGYKRLDEILKVLGGGQMVVLASRPGIGKTTFALNVLRNNFGLLDKEDLNSKAIGFFSLEMHHQELITKLLSMESGIELPVVKRLLEGGIISESQNAAIEKAKSTISGLNILFCDDTSLTAGNITSHIKSWVRKHKLKLVIVDYLQLISSSHDRKLDSYQQYLKIGMVSRNLKLLAMEMDICVLALAQLNRKVEERRASDKAPILSDLRESGSIEQDADVVMFLYEDKLEGLNAEALGRERTTVIKVAKNRHGPTDSVEFDFIKHRGLFVQLH